MIDVHVLVHEGTTQYQLERCLNSLRGEPCNVQVVENANASVGAGRAKGYSAGVAPLVSYIDSDDELLPGTYRAVLDALEQRRSVVTMEEVVTEATGFVCPQKRPMHAVVGFRREDVEPLIPYMEATPWCVDVLMRRTLAPVQLDITGVRAYYRPGTARQRVTREQMNYEETIWPTRTTPQ